MQKENRTPEKPAIPRPMLWIISLMINFFGCGFLTFPVLITFAVLVFDYLVIFGTNLPFLKYLSFLPGMSSSSDIHINGNDIVWGYSLLTMVFWILLRLVRGLWSAVRRKPQRTRASEPGQTEVQAPRLILASLVGRFSRRLLLAFLPITAVFLIAFIALPFAKLANFGALIAFYLIFFIFYVIAAGSIAAHVLIDGSSQLMLDWARRQTVNKKGEGPSSQ